jgi:hypothetical protein
MKLISMTEFVLNQEIKGFQIQSLMHQTSQKAMRLSNCLKYAKFLKQPLELGMFVPTDENGNVLENKSCNLSCSQSDFSENGKCGLNGCYNQTKQYQQAKERVLFEDCGIIDKWFAQLSNGFLLGKVECLHNLTIEDLIQFNLTLTQTAINKL